MKRFQLGLLSAFCTCCISLYGQIYLFNRADFPNHDGKIDLIVVSGDKSFSVLLGNGDGTFQPHVDYSALYSGIAYTADLNADGKSDVLLDSMYFFQGNGDRTIQPGRFVNFPNGRGGHLAIADFDDDGSLDIVATNPGEQSTITVLLNKPVVALFPTTLSFSTQLVGTNSRARAFTVYNPGSGPLPISTVQITGSDSTDFNQTNNCGASVSVGSQCRVSITFNRSAQGTRTATAWLHDGALGKVQPVYLSGTGTVMTLVPASMNFGRHPLGTSSPPQIATLKNHGSAPVTINSMSILGLGKNDYSITVTTCGGSLGSGANCTITLVFRPSYRDLRVGVLTIKDTGGGSPHIVQLYGTGN